MSMKLELLHRLYGTTQLYRSWASLQPLLRPLLPTAGTGLCIEGYPRSGNTFGVLSFEKVQPMRIRLSHHLHAEGQVLWACRRGIPVIILLRNPVDAIASLVLRHPEYSDELAARRYVAFYDLVSRVLDRVVISRFQSTVAGLGSAVLAANEKFGTSFVVPADVDDAGIFRQIDNLNVSREHAAMTKIARPDSSKEAPLIEIKQRLESSDHLAESFEMWRRLDAVAV
jgi:hypothetical protein